MDKPECSICDNTFDSDDHRPRVLPCGHGFCSMCIETSIHRGDKTCAICRKEYGARTSTDLPVNFLLEDFAHKLALSASQKLVHVGNYGMCSKHKEIPLYFNCKSHSIKVCHSCAVIDHPPTSCHLISFEDEIKETKNSQIEAFKKQNQVIMNMERDLYNRHQENMGEIDLLVTKIEQINQEITEKREFQEKIRDAIKLCQQKQKSFIIMENNLSAATSNQDITIQCKLGKTEVLQSQKWEQTLKKELIIEQMYAQVERRGVLRSCRVFEENGRLFIPCMSREVKPSSSARLVKEAKLGLNSSTTTVFIDISERGHSLGRVIISIFGDTYHGQHFIKRVLGIDGLSIKGTNFTKRNVHYVTLEDYMTEGGSKGTLIFTPPTLNYISQVPARGMLFPDSFHGDSFVIWNGYRGGSRSMQFGTLISGMNVIDTVASNNFGVTEIQISDCGIVLNSW